MNYRVFLDTASKQFIGKFDKVKDFIQIGFSNVLYKVTRIEPNTNSITEPHSFDYFVRLPNTSPDSVTMDGSRQSFQKSIRSL